jgi:predicted Zn-dependent peptidase
LGKLYRLERANNFRSKRKACQYKTTLGNGIRVITETIPYFNSISLGMYILVGSRDETINNNGISHLIEHLLLKGTKRRTNKDINLFIDSIGGRFNGATTKEYTYYLVSFLREDLAKVCDFLRDILYNSLFSEEDIEKEKNLILQEIRRFKDSLSRYAIHRFSQTIFGQHPLSHPVIGTSESIKTLDRIKVLNFLYDNYIGERILIVAVGNIEHSTLVSMISKKFPQVKKRKKFREKSVLKLPTPEVKVEKRKNINQVYGVIGCRIPGYRWEKKICYGSFKYYLWG